MTTERNWRKEQKNPFLGAWDIPENGTLTVEFTEIKYRERISELSGANKWVGTIKNMKTPMIINTTNMKALEYLFQSKDPNMWLNKPVVLEVGKARAVGQNEEVDAIRVSLNRPKVKEKMTDDRWPNAKKAIETGAWTKEKLTAEYELTPQQLKELDAIQSK